ncbi:MAG TPA: pitrilysin family protein [Thermoplasmata archaeon]|nr:pitrilysin family protein [Thermoplasmata archaeon]
MVRFRLPNGLSVLLAADPTSPTASVWVWYRVGSKNEYTGITGASHWVEHMLFQGTPKYGKGEIDRAIVGVGGSLNAFTDHDFTAYFSTVPREHLDLPLDIEADRMTRALLDPKEVERERTVIRSEREGAENWPEFRVDEEVGELAYRRHPYRWDPLGYPEDILALTPKDLQVYYHRFYGTRNAVLVVSGGFDPASIARQVRAMFGRLPSTGEDPRVRVSEPEADRERRSRLEGPGSTPVLEVAYRAPAVADPLAPSTMLLDVVLGGETRLFSVGRGWGPSIEHPSSRLYRALVGSGLAVRATSQYRPRVHPGLFSISVQAARSVPLERLEAAVGREIGRLVREGPTRTELDDARAKVRRGADLAYEGASATGFRLGYFQMLGEEPGFETRLLQKVLRADAASVRATADKLFRPERRVVVTYNPTGGDPDE